MAGLKSILGLFGKSEKRSVSISDDAVANILGSPQIVATDSALSLSTSSRCISLIAGAFASADLMLMRQQGDGSVKPAVDNTLYSLLYNGTAGQSAYSLKFALMRDLVSFGNCYAIIRRDDQGRVTDIEPVEFQNVTREVLGGGRVQFRVRDYLNNFAETVYSSDDVFHGVFRPRNGVGVSPLRAAALTAGIASGTENATLKEVEAGFKLSGVLEAPGAITNETATRLKSSWEENYSGGGQGKLAVLGDGLKYSAMVSSSADRELLESRRINAYFIAQAYGVPAEMCGLPWASTWNNVSEASKNLVAHTLDPWSECLCQQLLTFCLGPIQRRTLFLKSDWSYMTAGNLSEKATAYNSLVAGAIMTPNEARAAFGDLPPLPGGNELRVPLNTAPAAADTASPTDPLAAPVAQN